MNKSPTDQKAYFADVGLWQASARHIERSYATGFVISFVLTVFAYGATVSGMIEKDVLVPLVLILAVIQFVVQVLNFLHVNGEPSARERLLALVYSSVLILALVIGSMWIMVNLRVRMDHDTSNMETYMQREVGI